MKGLVSGGGLSGGRRTDGGRNTDRKGSTRKPHRPGKKKGGIPGPVNENKVPP